MLVTSTLMYWSNSPVSRRLDRCDRVIQNESRDPTGGKCVCFQRRRARRNANYVPHAQICFDLYVSESLASLSIAMAFSRQLKHILNIYIYIIYSQDTVIDNIIAILYECEMCAV